MQIICSKCRAVLNIDESSVGAQVRCPKCDFVVDVEENRGAEDRNSEKNQASQENVHRKQLDATPHQMTPMGNDSPEEIPQKTQDVEENLAWYLRVPEGTEFGPINSEQLDIWVSQGRVSSDCLVRSNSSDWQCANLVYPMLNDEGNVPQRTKTVRSSIEPHRGTLILGLAIAGCFVPFLSLWPAALGTRDLRLMSQGKMDRSGDAMTRSGQAIGMVSSMIWVGAFAIALLWSLIRMMSTL